VFLLVSLCTANPWVGAASVQGAVPFAVGEKLEFSLQYGPIKAGTGTLLVSGIGRIGSTPCYHFVSLSRSVPFFDNIYPVRDQVESYADTANLVTYRIEKHLHEGTYRLDSVVRLDPERGRAVYKDGTVYTVAPTVRDALSAFYYIRTLDLSVGQTVSVPAHGDRKSYEIRVTVSRKETVKTPVGTFRCLVIQPTLKTTGIFRQTGDMTIWVTDDARKIPVKLSSKIAVGSIVGVLTAMSGTANMSLEGADRSDGRHGTP
jgi:hypothetical protein